MIASPLQSRSDKRIITTMGTDIVTLSKKLIAAPSITGDIDQAVKVVEIVKKELSDYKPTVFVHNHYPSLLYSNKDSKLNNFKIIFNAHLDVVPAGKKQFLPYEKEGKLYGRGSYDVKSSAAVFILLFKELANQLSYPIGLQLTTDEEVTGKNGTGYQLEKGVKADFAVVGECNSDFRITNQAKGRMIVQVRLKGVAAHSAYAWRGKNAVWEMYQALVPLMNAYPPDEDTHSTVVTITKIATDNKVTNQVPDDCTAFLDVRFVEKDRESLVKKIRSMLPPDAQVDFEHKHPVHHVDDNNPYILHLQSLVRKIRNEDLPLRKASGTSDATFFSIKGLNAVEFGPIGAGAHHENEWVDIHSLTDYYQILKTFLLELDK